MFLYPREYRKAVMIRASRLALGIPVDPRWPIEIGPDFKFEVQIFDVKTGQPLPRPRLDTGQKVDDEKRLSGIENSQPPSDRDND